MSIRVSVIAAFYNKIDFLKLTLAGFACQSNTDFEFVVADDGSNENTIAWLNKQLPSYPFINKHVWHEDKGWRKNAILNKALMEASGEYIIIIDSDCVPHPCFVEDHLRFARKGEVLAGRRVHLSEKLTSRLTEKNISEGYLERHIPFMFFDSLRKGTYDVEKGIRVTSPFLRKIADRKNRGLLGSNFSTYRQDFLDINGFDERYVAPSIGEDTDIQYRFEKAGKKIHSVNNMAVQYHLYHKILNHPAENIELFREVQAAGNYWTPFGIKKTPAA
ncbi:MAG: glycosyltransferase [Ignavibacteria bacterium]|nr:glycosyltransferase [Ignavibacteria bacterium]